MKLLFGMVGLLVFAFGLYLAMDTVLASGAGIPYHPIYNWAPVNAMARIGISLVIMLVGYFIALPEIKEFSAT